MSVPVLRVRNLNTRFATDRGVVHAVRGVSLDLDEGDVLGLVGESGSGKSVTALSVMRLVAPPAGRVTADEIAVDGVDVSRMCEAEMRELRGSRMAMVFQDPMRSLNPVLTIGRQLTEVLRRHQQREARDARKRAIELLEMVGITSAEKRLSSYPHQFSGGMRQRVMIAIALSCNPRLLICDEATTALDVTIQAQVIDLVRQLTRELRTAVIWISHDLGVVAGLCNKINVMYAGRIVEAAAARDLFHHPSHGYTLGLMRSTPRVDDVGGRLTPIDGMPPNLIEPDGLCPFLPRCRVAVADCRSKNPVRREVEPAHWAACFADLRSSWRGARLGA
jgi:oligopeptide transport system ATP-binding protein